MADNFFQQPLGIASLIGAAIVGPYAVFSDKPGSQTQNPPSISQPMLSDGSMPAGWPNFPNATGMDPINGGSSQNQMPFATIPGVPDLREVIRFDIHPDWVAQRFPRVTTVLAETRLDGRRVPFLSGTNPTDIAGSLTYYFDAAATVRRIQFHGVTGDPSMLVSLMTQFYGLQPEQTLGGYLFTARWNNRITSVLQLTPSAVISAQDHHARFQVFLELNQPSNDYGLTQEAEQLLLSSSLNQRW